MANVKINTTNTTGGYPEPVNPNTTGALAGGFYPQNSTSNDGNAGIERDSSNNLTVKSAASVNINGSTTSADAVVVAASTTGAALRVTQTGSGNAILVEDAANPDSTAFVVDSVGNVGIRTTLPSYDLDVQGDNSAAIAITAAGAAPTDASVNIGINDTTGDNYVRFGDGANYEQGRIRYNHDSDYMSFNTAQTEALRIDNTQQVAIGGGAPISMFSVSKDGFANATLRGNGTVAGAYTRHIRARGTVASPTIVNNGDYIGGVLFGGYDGSAYRDNAAMYGIVGGAPGASDMPGALAFATAADGTVTLTERMRIDAAGNVGIGTSPGSGIRFHVASDGNNWIRSQSAAGIPLINCNRSGGTTASPTAVAATDELGRFDVRGYNNGDFRQAAQITVGCSTTPGASDTAIAASIGFLTSPGGTTAPALRMTIDKDGYVGIGTTSTLGNSTLNVNAGIVARTPAASGTTPYLQTYNGNASTDLKTWRMGGNSSGSLVVETVNDAYSAATSRLTLTNAGVMTVAGQIESSSTGFKFPDATTQTTGALSNINIVTGLSTDPSTTSTTLSTITGLTAMSFSSLAINTPYILEAYLMWRSAATGTGAQFDLLSSVALASNPTPNFTLTWMNANGGNMVAQQVTTIGTSPTGYGPTSAGVANTTYIARITAAFATGGTSPTISVQYKSTTSGTAVTVMRGSWATLRKGFI